MKNFRDLENEIYTCSRCGLCQSVCPVFDATQKETTVSRGFFSTLMGVIKGHLKFNKKIRKNIDMCLACNKCFEFCPSGINATKIITAARFECYEYAPLWKKFLLSIFYSKTFLTCISAVKLYRFFPILNFTKTGKILQEFLTPQTTYKKKAAKKNSNIKVAIFSGCINKYFNSSSLNAMKMVLENYGIEYTIPDFDCCTMPAYSSGDFITFKKFAKKNLERIPEDIDFVLFDCSSCKHAFSIYAEFLEGEDKILAEKVYLKCKNINEFLYENNFEMPKIEENIVYHKPCHLDCYDKITELIEKTGANLIPIKDSCCGSGGLFFIENYKISNKIAKKRIEEMKSINSNIIFTDCPLCRLGLIKGGVLNEYPLKVNNFTELLSKNL